MSTDLTVRRRVSGTLGGTAIAIRGALSRWDGLLILLGSSVGYLGLYLWAIGHLGLGDSETGIIVVSDPLSMMTQQMGPYQWEPVAFVQLGLVEFLLSPLNLALGGFLALLVGLNLAVSWIAWRGPQACRIGPGAGLTAGLPALLSGMACCAPTILLILGIQASASLLTVFQWLLPIALITLLVTLVWVGRFVEPTAT